MAGLELTKQTWVIHTARPIQQTADGLLRVIYYLLTENGFKDVPRDSSQQYVWVRKAEISTRC